MGYEETVRNYNTHGGVSGDSMLESAADGAFANLWRPFVAVVSVQIPLRQSERVAGYARSECARRFQRCGGRCGARARQPEPHAARHSQQSEVGQEKLHHSGHSDVHHSAETIAEGDGKQNSCGCSFVVDLSRSSHHSVMLSMNFPLLRACESIAIASSSLSSRSYAWTALLPAAHAAARARKHRDIRSQSRDVLSQLLFSRV